MEAFTTGTAADDEARRNALDRHCKNPKADRLLAEKDNGAGVANAVNFNATFVPRVQFLRAARQVAPDLIATA